MHTLRALMNPLHIYIYRAGQQTGPYSGEEIRTHLASGALVPNDFAWYEGATEWMPLSSVPGVAVPPLIGGAALREVESKPLSRSWLVLGVLGSGFLALMALVGTGLWFTGSNAGKHASLAPLFIGLFMTAVGICLATQFVVALRRRNSGCCELCRRSVPTIRVSLNRHIGALILMFHRSQSGSFCKRCIGKTFREYTFTTLFLGWWGFLSFFVTPIVLINNVMVYVRSCFMQPRVQESSSTVH